MTPTMPAANNQVSDIVYDGAGDMIYDGIHSCMYDAEGNITKVDGGSTATYTYDALNHRVQTKANGATTEYVFNVNGQRVSEWNWNGTTASLNEGQYYWGSKPVAFYSTSYSNDGATVHYQHQDWLGTERMRTDDQANVEASFTSLPYGDAQTQTTSGGIDLDANHYAMLDFDSETNTDHAQFRQYSSIEGRWLRPDPYSGSYRPRNPQSFNRYSYVMNNPLSNVDPIGLKPIPCPGGLPTIAENGDFILNGCDDGGVVNCDPTDVNCASNAFGLQSFQFDDAAMASMSLSGVNVNAPNSVCSSGGHDPTMMPASVGGVLSAEATAGVGSAGESHQISVGGVHGLNSSAEGSFYSYTNFSGHGQNPPQNGTPEAVGDYGGFGVGFIVSNANNVSQLAGAFQTHTLSLPVGSVSLSTGNGIWSLQVTFGPGIIEAYSSSTSNTVILSNNKPCP